MTSAEATIALNTATATRADVANGGANSTVLLSAQQTDSVTATTTAKTALALVATTAAQKQAIIDFDAAVAAQAALPVLTAAQVQANSVAQASAQAGVDAVVKATGTTVTYATLNATFTPSGTTVAVSSAATLYAALKSNDLTTVQHAALVAEIQKVPTFGAALVASAEKELAVVKAAALVTSTKATVDLIDSDGPTVAGPPITGAKQEGLDYTAAVTAQKNATDLVTKAKAADVAVATAKVVTDQFVILNKAVADANTAIDTFNLGNTKAAITSLTGIVNIDATAKTDVFYFPTAKVNVATDISIGGATTAFGAGDAIVLGSGYTFNSGAVSTGNSNVLEFFLVKGATGTQVVVESDAFGNASTVVGTDGTVTASPNAAVINLVGVTLDHLSVANGVISYV